MDAHIFRRVAVKLAEFLRDARIEKIFRPAKDVLVFAVYSGQRKIFLFFRHGRRNQALFLSREKPQAPNVPDSEVMFFRKYFGGRRVASVTVDWPRRRFILHFLNGPESVDVNRRDSCDRDAAGESCGRALLRSANRSPALLLFDLREGVRALAEVPSDFVQAVEWPRHDNFSRVFDEAERVWETFPVITPLLRKTLAALDPLEASALLSDLESEASGPATEGETWVYEPENADDAESVISAWPLPEALRAGLRERVFENVLEAAEYAGAKAALAHVAAERDKTNVSTQGREIKRLKQVSQKLELEEKRLKSLLDRKQDALLLQARLYMFDADERRDSVDIPASETDDAPARRVILDPGLTVRENMFRIFQRAAKAVRGFEHLERRRREVKGAMDALLSRRECLAASGAVPSLSGRKKERNSGGSGRTGLGKVESGGKQVSSFISSDGFLLLRGRSAKGNREALKMAAPYDYWFHCEDGPSAHLILRRKHAAQTVPERSMLEAACLVAVKSWRKQDSGARVMYALARDVQPIKGGPDGKVKVLRRIGSYAVALDPELETRLRHNLE